MRPSCSYYDKQDKRKNDKNKAENSDEEDKEPEAQQVGYAALIRLPERDQ